MGHLSVGMGHRVMILSQQLLGELIAVSGATAQ